MLTLINQIEGSLSSGLYFLSLYTALTIPDIAGALGSENGEASGAKYASWFEQWVRPRFLENVLASLPPEHRQRLLEMGLTVGTQLEVVRFAPLGDPIDIKVRGYHLSLRKKEASGVQVTRV